MLLSMLLKYVLFWSLDSLSSWIGVRSSVFNLVAFVYMFTVWSSKMSEISCRELQSESVIKLFNVSFSTWSLSLSSYIILFGFYLSSMFDAYSFYSFLLFIWLNFKSWSSVFSLLMLGKFFWTFILDMNESFNSF